MKKVLESACFAAAKHTHQRRKNAGDTPYINHPLEVTHLLATVGGVTDEDVLSAALLHDTIEDTGTTPEEISLRFGATVLSYVLEVSDDKSLPKTERKRLQEEHAPALSHGAKLIKLADRIANLRSIVHEPPAGWPVSRQAEYFRWSQRVFQGLRNTNEALERLFLSEYEEGYAVVLAREKDPGYSNP